jgi:hypothetical protein
MGIGKALSGEARQGRLLCEESVDLATKTKDPRLISTSLLALAEALLVAGDAGAALTTAVHAQESFARLGQLDSEWHAWLIAARASRLMGNEKDGVDYAGRSNAILVKLEEEWGDEAYKGYLTRPDIQFYSKQCTTASTAVK